MGFDYLFTWVWAAFNSFVEFSDIVFDILSYEIEWLGGFSIWQVMFGPGFIIFVTVSILRN